jgi:hypothetical protein
MATIEVSRDPKPFRDKVRRYRVLIDDVEVGRLGRGETVAVEVVAGPHTVMVKLDWGTSPPIEVRAVGEEIIRCFCGPGGSAVSAAIDAFARPKRYLKLERVP